MKKKRLLNVARALRESKEPDEFTMAYYGLGCGTPACALGHYAVRSDLQDEFALDKEGDLIDRDGDPVAYADPSVRMHFGITAEQAGDLFSACGCGFAETALEAAEYIERWIAEQEAKP